MAVTTANAPTLGIPQRPLRRSSADSVLGGVCAGLAIRLGVAERPIRIVFAVSVFAFGVGPLIYVAIWLFLVRSGEEQSIAQRLTARRRDSHTVLLAFAAVVALLLLLHSLTLRNSGLFAWSLLLSAVGAVAV